MKKIIITPRSLSQPPHAYLNKLKEGGFELLFPAPGRQPTEEELLAIVPECVGWLAGVEPITQRVLEAAKQLKAISRNGTGVDNIDLKAAQQLGIKILKAEGANARGAAELTFAHLFAAVRHLLKADKNLKNEKWQRELGFELEGKTLGIVGLGKVGKIVADLALALGMKLIVFTRTQDPNLAESKGFCYVSLNDLLKESDIISLHIPALPQGPLLDEQAFKIIKNGAIVINTSRDSLIDKRAALEALNSGKIAYLTLDAYFKEPPDDWDLIKHPSVIATPHIGAYTIESVERATRIAVDNLLAALSD